MNSASAAIATKVRALYGRMLGGRDWDKLCHSKSTPELVWALRALPAWKDAMEQLPGDETTTQSFSAALWNQVADEQVRIYRFATMQDKRYLELVAYQYELKRILAALRRLSGREAGNNPLAGHPFFMEKIQINEELLETCTDWQGLLRATEKSVYSKTLHLIGLESGGLPSYAEAASLLEIRSYTAVFEYLEKKYTGPQKKRLQEYVGTQADCLNLTHLLRLKQFYPAAMNDLDGLLIPVRCHLTDPLIQQIRQAPDLEHVYELLRKKHWSQRFADGSYVPEKACDMALIDFCRRLLNNPDPGICTAQAYLTLKQIECRQLIRVYEAVRLGVDPVRVL